MASRRSKALYLGFFGSGTPSTKNINALLSGLLEPFDSVTFLIPATKGDYSDSIADVLEYLDKSNEVGNPIELHAVTDATTSKKDTLKGIEEDAQVSQKAASGVGTTIAGMVADAIENGDDGRMIMLWPEDPEESDMEAFEAANANDVPAFDLCSGLQTMTFDDGDDGDGGEDEPAESSSGNGIPSEEEMNEMGLTEVKRLGKRVGLTDDDMARKRKSTLIPLIIETAKGGSTPEPKKDSREPARDADDEDRVDQPTEPDDDADEAQAMSVSLLSALPDHARLTESTRLAIRSAAAEFAEALVTAFVVESRKPKSAGKPRADGIEAAPRKSAADESEQEPEAPARRSRR